MLKSSLSPEQQNKIKSFYQLILPELKKLIYQFTKKNLETHYNIELKKATTLFSDEKYLVYQVDFTHINQRPIYLAFPQSLAHYLVNFSLGAQDKYNFSSSTHKDISKVDEMVVQQFQTSFEKILHQLLQERFPKLTPKPHKKLNEFDILTIQEGHKTHMVMEIILFDQSNNYFFELIFSEHFLKELTISY